MVSEITTQHVTAQLIAAVQRRVRIGDVKNAWKAPLDQVWAFLRNNEGLRREGGHNVFLYQHPKQRDEPMDVAFGVQVTREFASEAGGDVICMRTPAGEVVTSLHVGAYDKLNVAHDAIRAWLAKSGRKSAGQSWEIYGDWSDDATKLETRVMYLLA